MKERPLIFSGQMVKALLDGRKTQTRRTWGLDVINESPNAWAFCELIEGEAKFRRPDGTTRLITCPYGVPGDRLWVKETFALKEWGDNACSLVNLNPDECYINTNIESVTAAPVRVIHRASYSYRQDAGPWKSSRYMPRWASRLLLEVTDVRVERVRDINEGDARAEGMAELNEEQKLAREAKPDWKLCGQCGGAGLYIHRGMEGTRFDQDCAQCDTPRKQFQWLWNSINAKKHGRLWGSNPWCWPITFKRIET